MMIVCGRGMEGSLFAAMSFQLRFLLTLLLWAIWQFSRPATHWASKTLFYSLCVCVCAIDCHHIIHMYSYSHVFVCAPIDHKYFICHRVSYMDVAVFSQCSARAECGAQAQGIGHRWCPAMGFSLQNQYHPIRLLLGK